jgi:hypothetical protein
VASESNQFGIGIPALERRERLGGMGAQHHVLTQQHNLMSTDCSLALRSDHGATVYDRHNA